MSSQVKKRFEELTTYLGKDTRGLALLKSLKDDVNVLRKKLAAAEEKSAQDEALKIAARERADAMELADAATQLEMQSLRQRVANVERNTNAALQSISSIDSEDDVYVDGSEASIKNVLKSLRKSLPVCPTSPFFVPGSKPQLPIYDRERLAAGWSRRRLWELGAAVAVLTAMTGRIAVGTGKRIQDVADLDGRFGLGRQLGLWFTDELDRQDNKDADLRRLMGVKYGESLFDRLPE